MLPTRVSGSIPVAVALATAIGRAFVFLGPYVLGDLDNFPGVLQSLNCSGAPRKQPAGTLSQVSTFPTANRLSFGTAASARSLTSGPNVLRGRRQVRNRVTEVLRKLAVRDRAEAVQVARDNCSV
jgi:hypothetical protein